ncbi:unnamed protein product [Heterobilharzia americana]|nr:unnamed protein product [Heterobilharzia americana]
MRYPLCDKTLINQRLDAVEFLLGENAEEFLQSVRIILKNIGNLQKIIFRMQTSSALPHDWKTLIRTLNALETLIAVCLPYQGKLYPMQELLSEKFDTSIIGDINSWLIHVIDTEKTEKQQRFVVRRGVDSTLDQWGEMYTCLPDVLSQLAEDELANLRGNVQTCGLIYFPLVGYLLKIPKAEVETPDIQLSGLEFAFTDGEMAYYRNNTTRALDERYGDVMYAIIDAETIIMHRLQDRLLIHAQSILRASQFAAEIDCLCSFAITAKFMDWTRPRLTDNQCIYIYNGRHPIQQTQCPNIIKNSFYANASRNRITMLTGPNGSGKSIYMKQVRKVKTCVN